MRILWWTLNALLLGLPWIIAACIEADESYKMAKRMNRKA